MSAHPEAAEETSTVPLKPPVTQAHGCVVTSERGEERTGGEAGAGNGTTARSTSEGTGGGS